MGWHWPGLLHRAGWVGDISYSSYLLHFPLQIVFALEFDGLGFKRDNCFQRWAMLLFFAVLIPMSLACPRWSSDPPSATYATAGWQMFANRAHGQRPDAAPHAHFLFGLEPIGPPWGNREQTYQAVQFEATPTFPTKISKSPMIALCHHHGSLPL